MEVNPINVIILLLSAFQQFKIPESPLNNREVELKKAIEKILLDAMTEYTVDIIEEETLDFQEPFKDCDANIFEDERWASQQFELPEGQCSQDKENLSHEYKLNAVNFWRSGKSGNLQLDTVRNRFRKVSSITQLKRWAHQLNKGGTYTEKLYRIGQYVLENFKNSIEAGLMVHDTNLRRWALQAQEEIGHTDIRFKASKKWLIKFKKSHRIVGRKVNKFITRKTLENVDNLKSEANKFVNKIRPYLSKPGPQNIYNSDQSGFQLEIHSGRTLAVEGTAKVECLVQSVSATTHSYTIQPLISADGRLLSPLFIVLKEATGRFGPIVEANLFKPRNVYVTASKSGKLTSDHFKLWLEEVFYPNVGQESILLLDSWSGHCSDAVAKAKNPRNKKLNVEIIPKGTTGRIQPLDVYGFRIWKNYVRHFSDSVMLLNYEVNLHKRNDIIKLQSLVHNQLTSPRYINLFKYSWYKSGYIGEKPDEFDNPVEFAFGQMETVKCEIAGCNEVGVIRCSWCKKVLCFKHFYEEYHYCSQYEP